MLEIRQFFPILNRKINGNPLIYFDNAATTQKPQQVINALTKYYENTNSNVHRGVHKLSEEATEDYEATRQAIANFLNAKSPDEIIFTKNTTEAINLVAYSWGEKNIQENDEIIISEMEHHSNFIPWQQLAKRKKAKLKIIPLKPDFTLDMEAYKALLSEKTKLVSVTAMSNVTGTLVDIKTITIEAHKVGATVLIDGAQSVAHSKTDLQDLDCDFFTFSAHKMLGPTGVGILYGKPELLEQMPPFLFGGSMVKNVTLEETEFADPPQRFEAGTQDIGNIVAFKAAIDFLNEAGMEKIHDHEKELLKEARTLLSKFPEVTIYGPTNLDQSGPVISFTIKGIHPHDIASIFNEFGIAIRAGHHCAQPLMQKLNIPATARISFYLYNTKEELATLEEALIKTIETFK